MDDWKTDSAITNYAKIGEKDYLILAIREMSRQYVGKTCGQEIIWTDPPEYWPEELGPWKNPTYSNKAKNYTKDNVEVLRKKFRFLKENVPSNKFSKFQQDCFEIYGNGQMNDLSQLLNLEKMKEQLIGMHKFLCRENSSFPLVCSKVIEVKTLMTQISNEVAKEGSLKLPVPKRKSSSSAATDKSIKKNRDHSPSFTPLNSKYVCYILPQTTTAEPKNHVTKGITVLANHSSISSSAPKDDLSIQNTSSYPSNCLPPQVHQNPASSSSGQSLEKSNQLVQTENEGPFQQLSLHLDKASRSVDSGRFSSDTLSNADDQNTDGELHPSPQGSPLPDWVDDLITNPESPLLFKEIPDSFPHMTALDDNFQEDL